MKDKKLPAELTPEQISIARDLGNRALELTGRSLDDAADLLMLAASVVSRNSELHKRKVALMREMRAKHLAKLRLEIRDSAEIKEYADVLAKADEVIGARNAKYEAQVSARDSLIAEIERKSKDLTDEVNELKHSKKRLRDALEREREEPEKLREVVAQHKVVTQ